MPRRMPNAPSGHSWPRWRRSSPRCSSRSTRCSTCSWCARSASLRRPRNGSAPATGPPRSSRLAALRKSLRWYAHSTGCVRVSTRPCAFSSDEGAHVRLAGARVSDIFVSYSQTDRACAQELVEILEAQGLKCWIAPRDISPSADWAAEIIDAISAARVMLLVFSASSNQSPQVRREVERAVHKGVTVLPFRIENVVPSKSLEFFLSAQHWMDAFPPPRADHYRRLAKYLSTLPAGASPGPLPTASADTRV